MVHLPFDKCLQRHGGAVDNAAPFIYDIAGEQRPLLRIFEIVQVSDPLLPTFGTFRY